MASKWSKHATIVAFSIMAIGLLTSASLKAAPSLERMKFDQLLATRDAEAKKLVEMAVPSIERVGAAEYARLAQLNAEQGSKVKQLDIEITKMASAMNLSTPEGDRRNLEDKLVAARAAYSGAKAEWAQIPGSPEKEKYLKKIEKLTAMLDRIESDYKAKRKTDKELLKDMEDLLKVE